MPVRTALVFLETSIPIRNHHPVLLEEDKKLAYDTNAIYMILSLMEADEPILRGFHVDAEKEVTVHDLKVV